jgi:hypothetical protein
MGGTGGGAIVGPAAYGIFEAAHGFFLRPTLMGGHSLGGLSRSAEAPATFLGSRFDACGRIPGMYREQLGLQLDFCLGGEVGFSRLDAGVAASVGVGTSTSPTIPFVGVGPSVGLRGELGNRLSAVVRGVADLSLLRDPVALAGGTTMTPAVLVARAEVGLSWSLR